MPDRRNLLSPSVFPGQFVPAERALPPMRAATRDVSVRVLGMPLELEEIAGRRRRSAACP